MTTSGPYVHVGRRLKRILLTLNVKQKDFAQKIGMHSSMVSLIVQGHRHIKTEVAQYLHLQWKVNLNWLFCGTGSMFVQKKSR